MSDAGCTFTTTGPVVTIEAAHIANRLTAIRQSPRDSQLQTKYIDLYVIGALLKQIDAVVRRTPIINIFGNFKDKLVRLHIRGLWSESPPN